MSHSVLLRIAISDLDDRTRGALAIAGVVEEATDTRRRKEPGGTSSFALIVKESDSKSLPLHVVKKHVKPDDLRALVGHRVSALHHGGVVYDLRSERGILFTFSDTVPIAARKATAPYWSGIASLAVGLLLLWLKSRRVGHPL